MLDLQYRRLAAAFILLSAFMSGCAARNNAKLTKQLGPVLYCPDGGKKALVQHKAKDGTITYTCVPIKGK